MRHFKSVAKSALASLALRLPKGTREAITGRLTDDGTFDYGSFLALAKRFNVTELRVRGDYGIFQSTSDDSSVLGSYARSGTWAPKTNDLVQAFFSRRRGGTYVDVGANIGLTTVPIAQNANVRCIALEPEPTNFRNLMQNIAANCHNDNVTALQVAAFSTKTVVEFELANGNLGDHRVRLKNEPGLLDEHTRRTIRVEAAPIDDLVGLVDGPLAVKIDTQGAEPFVVEGGKDTLGRAELVIMEFWPYGMKRMGADPERVLRYFQRHFQTISLSHEYDSVVADIPVDRAIADLRQCVDARFRDKRFYLDLIATRVLA